MFDIKRTAVIGMIIVSSVLSGCSSMGVGEAEYRCPGIPDGIRCMSAQDAYQLTNGDDYREQVHNAAMKAKAEAEDKDYVETNYANVQKSVQASTDSASDQGPIPGVVPYSVKKVLPLRTPAKVMRIAFRAWESKEGALHVPGYVYTEIESRRWMIGEREVESSMRLKPVQVRETADNNVSDEVSGVRDTLQRNLLPQ